MSAKHQGISFLLRVAVAFALGLLLAGGAAVAFAALMVSRGLTQSVVWPFATASVCAGCLFSGYLLARVQRENGLVCGALQGGLFAALLLAAGMLSESVPDTAQLIRLLLILLCGCTGGFLGVNSAAKARRKH